jgi:hypothetical protein
MKDSGFGAWVDEHLQFEMSEAQTKLYNQAAEKYGTIQKKTNWSRTMEFVNLTPHAITIRPEGGGGQTFASQGMARISDATSPAGNVDGLPVVEVAPGIVTGLPEPREGVVYLVARLVAAAMPDRTDLLFPFGEIRDGGGRIVGVSAFGKMAQQQLGATL